MCDGYRRYVSIVCPRGYEPRALPLRHAGEDVLCAQLASWTIVVDVRNVDDNQFFLYF
jgi:hypothetical protein